MMQKIILVVPFLLAILQTVICVTVYVSSANCGGSYSVASNSVYLKYSGGSFGAECTFTFTNTFSGICVKPKDFDLKSCGVNIEYHNGIVTSFPDATYTCTSKQYSDYCTDLYKLYIKFEKKGTYLGFRSDDIELKIYSNNITDKDNTVLNSGEIVDAVKTTVHVIVGVIVGIVILIIVIIVVVVYCCCVRRRNQAGTVYRTPQQAACATTAGAYPMQPNQAGYQAPPGGYQPPPAGYQYPQTGYQPGYQPSPAGYQQPGGYPGYQQPAAGYPPDSQQAYAGYQKGPDNMSEKPTSMPSAPPMSVEPPPYPGN